MPAPPYVAPNELIASAWGNGVVDELIRLDTADVALQDRRPLIVTSTISGNNVPQGLTTLTGTITIPYSPVNRTWTFAWNYFFSGHSTGSQYRVRLFLSPSGADIAISGYDTYTANNPFGGVFIHPLAVAPAPAFAVGFKLEIVTVAANTNVTGVCVATGIATT